MARLNPLRSHVSLLGLLTLGLVACTPSASGLPPEAFGTFEDTNDPVFEKRLDLGAESVAYFIGVNLPGRPRSAPTVCRAEVTEGLRRVMDLTLNCEGTLIPFRFEYRADREDWVVREEDSAPVVYSRRRLR
jgi:hypothetical protein